MSIDEKKASKWEDFRVRTLEIAARRNNSDFEKYIGSLTERAWNYVEVLLRRSEKPITLLF